MGHGPPCWPMFPAPSTTHLYTNSKRCIGKLGLEKHYSPSDGEQPSSHPQRSRLGFLVDRQKPSGLEFHPVQLRSALQTAWGRSSKEEELQSAIALDKEQIWEIGTPLEEELQSAIALYKEQLEEIDVALADDPDNEELLTEQKGEFDAAFGDDADNEEFLTVRKELNDALTETAAVVEESFKTSTEAPEPDGLNAAEAACLREDSYELQAEGEGPSKLPRLTITGKHALEQDAEPNPGAPAAAQEPGRGYRNNVRIHPNNRYYREEPDFTALAVQYPNLAKFVSKGPDGRDHFDYTSLEGTKTLTATLTQSESKSYYGRAHFDYTSWEGTKTLTATLLHSDFGVEWSLPEGHLVPPVTNRANYIHWLNDLLLLSSPSGLETPRGLDIGCGANFIYCLLGAAVYGWEMVGADVTGGSVGM
eukprot:gene24671-10301_t